MSDSSSLNNLNKYSRNSASTNTSFNELSTVQIKKTTNDFSLVDTVATIAVNEEFTKGYRELLENKETENVFLWKALSCLGQEISETIYSNVLNYIDNVANIDTCTVKALNSMATVLGTTSNNLSSLIEITPPEILRLLDILSIPQSKLITTFVVNPEMFSTLLMNTAKESGFNEKFNNLKKAVASSEIIKGNLEVLASVSKKVYREFVKAAFLNELSNNININYDGTILSYNDNNANAELPDDSLFVCKNLILSSSYERSAETQLVDMSTMSNSDAFANGYLNIVKLNYRYIDKLDLLKKRYDLLDFDADKILDDIEDGKDLFENYSGNKSYILTLVKKYRTEAFLPNNSLTRFAYYQEKKVLDYLRFLNRMYMVSSPNMLATLLKNNYNEYDLDSNYIEIKDDRSKIDGKADRSKFVYNLTGKYNGYPKVSVIEAVANILTDVAFSIADLRSTLKTQSQRNHMRGTFVLLSYVISEYLKKNLPVQYPALANTFSELSSVSRDQIVNVIEYLDTTEYYNLSTDSSQYALNSSKVNYPYWKAENDDFTGVGLALSDIDKFYLNTLNLKTAVSDTSAFLNIIYELGADKTYIDKNLSDTIVVTEMFDGKDEEVIQDPTLSTKFNEISAYQTEIFLKYGGNKYSYKPYFNWKNITHSSYQIHPYLYRFVEYSNLAYSIKNSFASDANAQLLMALETSEISTCLGNYGNIINIWDRNCVDYSGYRSRYESNTHNQETSYGKITPLQHYDGVFYPTAVDEYLELVNPNHSISSVPKFTLSSVAHRLTGTDIVNMLSVEGMSIETSLKQDKISAIYKTLGGSNTLSAYVNYISAHQQFELDLSNALETGIPEKIADARNVIRELEEVGPQPTFYEKWYSHLNLPMEDAIKIAAQLSLYYDTINTLYHDSYADVYKYGIDKYSNSYLLYKRYKSDTSDLDPKKAAYKLKQNTLGNLWFKYNAHPIGFPLLSWLSVSISDICDTFGFNEEDLADNTALSIKLADLSQISLTGMNVALEALKQSENGILVNDNAIYDSYKLFYDFDFTSDYKYLFLAYYDKSLRGSAKYSKASIMSIKPFEDQYDYNSQFENLIHLELQAVDSDTSFNFATNGEVIIPESDPDAASSNLLSLYDFKGFYQDPEQAMVYALYLKRIDNTNQSDKFISIAKVQFPGEKISYASFETYMSMPGYDYGTTGLNKLNLTNKIVVPTRQEADIQIGFCNNEYTLAFLTQLPETFDGRNYVGFNSFKSNLSVETSLSGIYDNVYGKCNYIEDPKHNTVNNEEESNSFDRFDTFVTLVSFNDDALRTVTNNIIAKNYNLNSDASYIPLYASFDGQIRLWAAEYYKQQRIHSLQLLGMSFNNLPTKIDNFSYGIFTDTEGNLTLVNPIEYLSANYRVFEEFDELAFFLSATNEVLRPVKTNNEYVNPHWTISFDSLSANLNADTKDRYRIMIYNIERGPRFPILNCPLSVFNSYLSSSPDGLSVLADYDNIPTSADLYFKNNQYLERYTSEIRGTANIFENKDDFRVTSINTNYIFSISSITPTLSYDSNNVPRKLDLEFNIDRSYYDNPTNNPNMPFPYIIDKETLGVFVYKDSLDEYDNYHYIYHHLDWPYSKVSNEAISTELSSFPLSATSFDDKGIVLSSINEVTEEFIHPISDGSLAFKISEEVENTEIKYPDGLTKSAIFELFGRLNKEYSSLSNVFSEENTFVFELTPPKEIADLVGTVSMGIYSDGVDSIRVYEDYLSAMHSISENELSILPYLKFSTLNYVDDQGTPHTASGAATEKTDNIGFTNISSSAFSGKTLDEALSYLSTELSVGCKLSDKADGNINAPNMTIDYTVTEDDIRDFLKLYVNYSHTTDGIELFFNYNNLFDTPYTYRSPDGYFAPVFKENTYLRLKPGEDGILDVVIQVKYFDSFGEVCGIKDIPALSYKIYNVSDDKPKFVISTTWKLSPETVGSVKETAIAYSDATLTIGSPTFSFINTIDNENIADQIYLNADFTTTRDLTCFCDVTVRSNLAKIKSLTCDVLLDYSDPFVLFNQAMSKDAAFITRDGYIRSICLSSEYNTDASFTLGFTILKGTPVDPDTGQYKIPIDAINFKAKNSADAYVTSTYVIPGTITLDFGTITNKKYLAKESETATSDNLFKGFILAENSDLIRIFKGGEEN